jgi:hypothetical protein
MIRVHCRENRRGSWLRCRMLCSFYRTGLFFLSRFRDKRNLQQGPILYTGNNTGFLIFSPYAVASPVISHLWLSARIG